jgi:hypothetical protein
LCDVPKNDQNEAANIAAGAVVPANQQPASAHKTDQPHKTQHTWLEKSAVAIAVLAFLAAAGQGWIARDTEKRSLRANVVVTGAHFARDEAGQLKRGLPGSNNSRELLIYYDVSNEGVTPAYELVKLVDVQFPFTGKVDFRYTDGTAAYLPKQHTFGPVRTRGFTDEEVKTIEDGTVPFVFAGRITYSDIFGNKWPTNFCFLWAARPIEPGFGFCPRWNEGDILNYAR